MILSCFAIFAIFVLDRNEAVLDYSLIESKFQISDSAGYIVPQKKAQSRTS